MRKVFAGCAFLFFAAVPFICVAIPFGLWSYERYQTQQLLNNNVARAADDYADAMRNLNDQLERFEKQR